MLTDPDAASIPITDLGSEMRHGQGDMQAMLNELSLLCLNPREQRELRAMSLAELVLYLASIGLSKIGSALDASFLANGRGNFIRLLFHAPAQLETARILSGCSAVAPTEAPDPGRAILDFPLAGTDPSLEGVRDIALSPAGIDVPIYASQPPDGFWSEQDLQTIEQAISTAATTMKQLWGFDINGKIDRIDVLPSSGSWGGFQTNFHPGTGAGERYMYIAADKAALSQVGLWTNELFTLMSGVAERDMEQFPPNAVIEEGLSAIAQWRAAAVAGTTVEKAELPAFWGLMQAYSTVPLAEIDIRRLGSMIGGSPESAETLRAVLQESAGMSFGHQLAAALQARGDATFDADFAAITTALREYRATNPKSDYQQEVQALREKIPWLADLLPEGQSTADSNALIMFGVPDSYFVIELQGAGTIVTTEATVTYGGTSKLMQDGADSAGQDGIIALPRAITASYLADNAVTITSASGAGLTVGPVGK